jgi:hypothetical protein
MDATIALSILFLLCGAAILAIWVLGLKRLSGNSRTRIKGRPVPRGAITEGIIIVDAFYSIVELNDAACMLFDAERHTLRGRPLESILPNISASIRESLKSGANIESVEGNLISGRFDGGGKVARKSTFLVSVAFGGCRQKDYRLILLKISTTNDRKKAEGVI